MIPRETINQIIETARIEDVVSEFVTLRKRGSNLIGVCPFHKEKTPSFNVNPARNIFKCFGCGKAGDSVRFIMEHEHYSFQEALRYLAKKYGIKIEEREQTPEELAAQNERERMFNINSFAQEYFSNTMMTSDEGQSVGLAYFHERGFRDAIINKFQLGYCPNSGSAFTEYAMQHGYDKDLLIKVGLTGSYENRLYDRYQGRVIFPIHNLTGKVIGFGGRILTSEKTKAKYVNSPESEIYNKSQTLYGIFFARNEISRLDNCILVEGYADVLSMHQAGIENVVASSGTSLTTEQIRMISRYTKNVTMLYDGDAAGIHAALRGTNMILEEGMNVRIVVLPPEDDPDSFVQNNPIEVVTKYLEDNARDFIGFKTNLLLKDAKNDPIKRATVIKDIVETIAVIPDPIYRATYIKECSRTLEMPEQTLTNEVNKILRAKYRKQLGLDPSKDQSYLTYESYQTYQTYSSQNQQQVEPKDTTPVGFFQEQELVKLLLAHGNETIDIEGKDENDQDVVYTTTIASLIVDDLKNDGLLFRDPTHKKIFDAFDRGLDINQIPTAQDFISSEDEDVAVLAANLLSTQYKLDDWQRHRIVVRTEDDVLKKTVLSSILRFKDMVIEDRRTAIVKELQSCTDPDEQLALLQQKKHLDDIRTRINHDLGIVITK
ncbi:MAG: DNA primase [Bacteroidales bacterium]|nr:DNA primase [Bacteroidales bacterium]